jgi:hypothetical protein
VARQRSIAGPQERNRDVIGTAATAEDNRGRIFFSTTGARADTALGVFPSIGFPDQGHRRSICLESTARTNLSLQKNGLKTRIEWIKSGLRQTRVSPRPELPLETGARRSLDIEAKPRYK